MGKTSSRDFGSADWRPQKKNPRQRLDLVPETAITGNITEFINFLASVRETFDLHATLQNLIPNVWVVAHFR